MPQSMTYKGNSVIYFRGDASKKIYILQSGRVILKREELESGQEIQEPIQTGEFFGVKSALGKYDRDEDAIVVTDAAVVMFTVEEFEQLMGSNPRIGIKMLKVFSTQLRKVHGKVQALLAVEERDPEDGLYSNAEFYLKKKRYVEAIHILRRYQKHFPQGRYVQQAGKYLQTAEEYLTKYGANNGPAMISDEGEKHSQAKKPPRSETSDDEKKYYDALSLSSQSKYQEALVKFQALVESIEDEEVKQKCVLEIGRCHFGLKQYEQCIRHYGAMIKASPEHPDSGDAMFLVGQSYEALGDKSKALGVYERVLQMGDRLPDDIRKKIKNAQKSLGAN